MIAKLKVGNPELKVDYYQNYELTFPINTESKFAVKNLMKQLQNNKKELEVKVDLFKRQRTLDQNALMWELLSEYASVLNGGRRSQTTEEELYYKALLKHGIALFVLVREDAINSLTQVYKDVKVIDNMVIRGNNYINCKCILGSSKYTTNQMADLIEGILDDMSNAGINTPTMQSLEEEWRSYYAK